MNKQEILEYNEKCAKFLGAYFCNDDQIAYPNGYWVIHNNEIDLPSNLEDMQFHSDWNWIIDIVEKIFINFYNFNPCPIGLKIEIEKQLIKTNKEAIVQAINQFLIWYEQNK